MTEPSLPLATRLWFAFVCLLRVLTDAKFAGRAYLVRDALPAPEPSPAPPAPAPAPPAPAPAPAAAPAAPAVAAGPGPEQGALQVLAMLQREGRLLDFLEEEVAGASDADLGAAARQVHENCRKALRSCLKLTPVLAGAEGQPLTVPADYDAGAVKLTGNLKGGGPYRGLLRHQGYRGEVRLPTLLPGSDPQVLAPAEVEL